MSQNSGIPDGSAAASAGRGVVSGSSFREAASPAAISSAVAGDAPVMMACLRSYRGFVSARY